MFGNKLNVNEIDISNSENLELTRNKNVLSVPTILIGSHRLSSNIDETDLVDAILQGFLSSVELTGSNENSNDLGNGSIESTSFEINYTNEINQKTQKSEKQLDG